MDIICLSKRQAEERQRAGANPGSGRSQRHFRWHLQVVLQLPESRGSCHWCSGSCQSSRGSCHWLFLAAAWVLVAAATGCFWQLPEFMAASKVFLAVFAVCSVKTTLFSVPCGGVVFFFFFLNDDAKFPQFVLLLLLYIFMYQLPEFVPGVTIVCRRFCCKLQFDFYIKDLMMHIIYQQADAIRIWTQ